MTASEFAPAVLKAGVDAGITPRGIVIAFATVYVEADWIMYANAKVPESMAIPHQAVGSDGLSVGLFQQQVRDDGNGWWWADAATCMDPYKSAALFFSRLKKLDYNSTANSPGSYAQAVQQSAFPDRYDEHMADAQALYNQLTAGGVPVSTERPDFNEFPRWSENSNDRGGVAIDLFLLHTEEGHFGDDDAALDLAIWMESNGVSYHYTVSQASDGGTTVVDVVDTDLMSWSVLSANNRSINLCFAGSSVNDSRDVWLARSGALDAAAYIAAQDCIKYGIALRVVPPPYNTGTPGVSDHQYVTKVLKDGTHTDVGPNFPWDYFTTQFNKWVSVIKGEVVSPPDTDPPVVTPPGDPIDRIYFEVTNLYPSRSRYRANDDGVDTLVGFILNIDARGHEFQVERYALLGSVDAIALVKREADKGDLVAQDIYSQCVAKGLVK